MGDSLGIGYLLGHHGWLLKRGHRLKTWKRRWFFFRSGGDSCPRLVKLFYGENECDGVHINFIALDEHSAISETAEHFPSPKVRQAWGEGDLVAWC